MVRSAWVLLVLLVMSLTACGGGGGGGTSTVVVSGVASKGPFVSGTVNVYDVSAGIDAKTLIDNGGINSDGRYGVTIPVTSKPIMIEVAAGSQYIDEAKVTLTRDQKRTTLATPLRAIIPTGSATATVNVTPFTELAVRKVEIANSVSESVINDANALIARVYGLPDILTTTPADASSEFNSTDQNVIKYGLALAAVSQLTQGSSLSSALGVLEVKGNLLGTETSEQFKNALDTFLKSANNINSGNYPDINATTFTVVGTTPATTADVDVSLSRDFSDKNISFLNFRIRISPANSVDVTSIPGLTLLNGVQDKAAVQLPSYGETLDLFTVFILKNSGNNVGFKILPGVPFLRVSFPIREGVPSFTPSLEVLNSITPQPIGFVVPGSENSELPSPPVTASDFSLTVTYKDAAGNPL